MDKKLRFLIIAVVVGLFVGFSNYDNADKTPVHAARPGLRQLGKQSKQLVGNS
ncbi:MAG: hypothetical protein ABUK16_11505 [Anaerolineales bacterium]